MPRDLTAEPEFEVVSFEHPLRDDRRAFRMHEGATVAEIVARAGIDPRFLTTVQVVISRGVHSTVVPVDMWHRVRPRQGSHVQIAPRVEGPAAGLLISAILPSAASYVAGAFFTAGTLGYALAYTAVTVVGSLLANSLIAPPVKPDQSSDDSNFTITGSGNAELPYGPVPMVLGRHLMYPPKSARGYTQGIGEDIYYYGRYCLGYGPVALETLRIGTTPITEFEGVELEFLNVDPTLTQANIPDLSPLVVGWRQGSDAMELYPDDIAEDSYSVRMEHNVPIVRRSRPRTEALEVDVTYTGLYNVGKKGDYGYQVRVQYRTRQVGGAWSAPVVETHSAKTRTSIRFTKSFTFTSPAEYEVEVTRLDEDSESTNIIDDGYLTGIRSIRTGDLPSDPDVAEVAVRIRASEQLNGQLETLNGVVQQLAPVWTVSGWTAPQPVRHPAWQYARVLMGPMREAPLADARIQLQDLKDWADEEPHWTCDAVIDQDTTVKEVLDLICATGRARRTLRNLKYSVIRDGAAGPVVQQFSPRNSWGFTGAVKFPKQIHGFRVRVLSEALEWKQDEVIVYADGYDELTADKLETLDLRGIVLASDDATGGNGWRLGRYHLAQHILRPEEFTWQADIDHLRCNMGDKVRVVHDVPKVGVGSGRIVEIGASGGNVDWLRLDENLAPSGGPFRLTVRRPDGTEVIFAASPAISPEFGWVPAVTLPEADIALGNFTLVEEMATESLELLVTTIRPGPDLTATLTGVPAAPAVLTADQGAIPNYVPTISTVSGFTNARPTTPRITEVGRSVEHDGDVRVFADLAWIAGDAFSADAFTVRVTYPSGASEQVARTSDRTARFELPDHGDYTVELVATGAGGVSDPATVVITRGPDEEQPDDVTGLTAETVDGNVLLFWGLGDEITSHFELRFLADGLPGGWDEAALLQEKIFGNVITRPAENGTYFVKAVSWFGVESELPTSIEVLDAAVLNGVIGTRITGMQGDIDLHGDRLDLAEVDLELLDAGDRDAGDRLDRLAEMLISAQASLSETQSRIAGAGIYVDEGTGRVEIAAFRHLDQRAVDLQVQLDSQAALISQTVTVTEMNTALAGLVLDPTQVPLLDELSLRVTTAESEIDGLQGTITQKADTVIVDGVDLRLVTAESEIDGLQGQIVQKVDIATFTPVEQRLTTAESTLSGFDGAAFQQNLTDIRRLTDEVDTANEQTLSGLLNDYATQEALRVDLAYVRRELVAVVSTEREASASARQALGVRIDDAVALVETETLSRATADEALASDVTQLQADLTSVDGAQQATASGLSALDGRVSTAEGTLTSQGTAITQVQAGLTTAEGEIDALQTDMGAVQGATAANASALSYLDGRVTAAEGTLTAQGTAITQVQAGLTTAEGEIDALQTDMGAVQGATAANAGALSALDTRVTTAEGTLTSQATSLTALTTTVGGNTAAIAQNLSSINGVRASYGVEVNANGVATGFGLVSDLVDGNPVSEFYIQADRFILSSPDQTYSGVPFQVFTSPTVVNGRTIPAGVYAERAMFHEGFFESLSAVSATLGSFKTAETGERVEITDDVIKVFDSNDVLRVQIGDLAA